jgi:hypothetical protein
MGLWDDPSLRRIRGEREKARRESTPGGSALAARRAELEASAPTPRAVGRDRTQGVTGFGPATRVWLLAEQIEAWAAGSGLLPGELRIEYAFARDWLDMRDAHTALVVWRRRADADLGDALE